MKRVTVTLVSSSLLIMLTKVDFNSKEQVSWAPRLTSKLTVIS